MSATLTTTTITALMREDVDGSTRTLLDLLTTEKMDGSDSTISATTTTVTVSSVTTNNTTPEMGPPLQSEITRSSSDGAQGRWSTVKQRLGLKGIICCRGGWAHPHPHNNNRSSSSALLPPVNYESDVRLQQSPAVNLATALAEERQLRQLTTAPVTPSSKVSLMRLMAEAAMEAGEEEEGGEVEGGKSGCCVCMERKKGAALIPCGHTFCRVCSREIWLNRGSCPLCNRPILDVLDIF